jgi:hypothetical protein
MYLMLREQRSNCAHHGVVKKMKGKEKRALQARARIFIMRLLIVLH